MDKLIELLRKQLDHRQILLDILVADNLRNKRHKPNCNCDRMATAEQTAIDAERAALDEIEALHAKG